MVLQWDSGTCISLHFFIFYRFMNHSSESLPLGCTLILKSWSLSMIKTDPAFASFSVFTVRIFLIIWSSFTLFGSKLTDNPLFLRLQAPSLQHIPLHSAHFLCLLPVLNSISDLFSCDQQPYCGKKICLTK